MSDTSVIIPDSRSRNAPSNYNVAATAASGVIKAAPGTLYRVRGNNGNGATRYIQFFNSITVPADTAVPVLVRKIATVADFDIDLTPYGRYFSTGISWANSSTLATKTIGSADTWLEAEYK